METDELDRKILAMLHKDARQSSSRIAKELNVTDRTVRNRIEKILDGGLAKIGLLVDQEAAGYPVISLIYIDTETDKAAEIAKTLSEESMVNYVATCLGNWDLTIQVYARSNTDLRRWIDETLGTIDGVNRITISVLPHIYKRPTEWFPAEWIVDEE